MATATEEQLNGLVKKLTTSAEEVEKHDRDAATAMSEGATTIKDALEVPDLDAARESARRLWGELLDFPVIKSLWRTMAPDDDPKIEERGLVQTADTIYYFENEVIRGGGDLSR